MSRLVPCSSCRRHVRPSAACPFCGAAIAPLPEPVEAVERPAAGAADRNGLLVGIVASAVALSSVGCCLAMYGGPPVPVYGGPPMPTVAPVTSSTPPAPSAAPSGPTLPEPTPPPSSGQP